MREATSPDAFRVIDDTVRRVLEERRTFWMTAGGLLAVWEISGATRAVMDVFDRIYGASRRRPFVERLRVSLALGLSVTVLLLAAAACVILGDDALGALGVGSSAVALLRYPAAAGLLLLVVAVLLRFAPVDHQPVHWVSFGSGLVVVAWLLTSLALGVYLREIANYGSVFGALATVWIVLTFLYFSAAAFLTGVEIDAQVRAQAAG